MDEASSPCTSLSGGGERSEQRLQVKIEPFEEKMVGEENEKLEGASPALQRRYSLTQAVREERREMRFNR